MTVNALEYLKSFRLAESRIQLKTRQVKDLQDRLLCISAPMDKEVVSHTPSVGVMADTIAMIVDLQKEIDQQAAIIIHQKRELFLLLDQIDPDYATLLSEHYLDGKSFVEIGKIHGYERRWAKRRMAKAVAQLQEILDQQLVNETMPISSDQDNH